LRDYPVFLACRADFLELERPPVLDSKAKRIFERLRAAHGYPGGYTVVKDHVRLKRMRIKEAFVPLAYPPGHAQVDFGQCVGIIGGVRTVMRVFCFDLPHSDAPFVKAYPAETTEAFRTGCLGLRRFRRVPLSILYDTPGGRWRGSWAMAGVPAPAPSASRLATFCSGTASVGPGKGNDKGKVEGLVKYTQRTFITPLPHAVSFEAIWRHWAASPRACSSLAKRSRPRGRRPGWRPIG
jgi:transposase